ncbi:MAG: flagellar biosynthetic protein FliR [Gammaproteobacteria bacterium]|nr:flagellar biosynthetic protein FliR [Gammaproteobacteria bacterium]
MLFTSEEIGGLLGSYFWPFVRIAAMVTAMPAFSSNFIPVRARLAIALGITVIVAPIIPAVPQIDTLSIQGALLILHQILIGVVMGFIFHLVFAVFVIGGQVIAMQMGLGFSTMVDPINGSQTPVLAMFFVLMVTLIFLGLDGHLALIGVVSDSFFSLPIAASGIEVAGYWELANWGTKMFSGAVLVALPAITALLLVNMAMGVMGRAAPQLNIFAVGFSVTITGGFYILMMTLPVVLAQFEIISTDAFTAVKGLVNQH